MKFQKHFQKARQNRIKMPYYCECEIQKHNL